MKKLFVILALAFASSLAQAAPPVIPTTGWYCNPGNCTNFKFLEQGTTGFNNWVYQPGYTPPPTTPPNTTPPGNGSGNGASNSGSKTSKATRIIRTAVKVAIAAIAIYVAYCLITEDTSVPEEERTCKRVPEPEPEALQPVLNTTNVYSRLW